MIPGKISGFLFILCALFGHACQPENEVRQGIHFIPAGLDPGKNFGSYEFQIYAQIYEPLLKLSEDYRSVLPCLAKSWSISADRLEYTFNLIPDVMFHDGSVLTAQDVQYSFYRQIGLRGDHPIYALIDTIMVLDALNFRITLEHPYSPFLYALASPNGLLVMSRKSLQRYGEDIGTHPVGTGPFALAEWVDREYISLKAFPQYRENSMISELTFVFPGRSDDSEIKFRDGKLDILYMVAGYWLDRLKWLGQVTYFVQRPMNTLYLGFNLKNAPVNNLQIRKAILKSLDLKKMILTTNRGNAIVARGPLPPIYKEFEDLKQEEFDNQQVRSLLEKTGYPGVLNFYVPEYTLSRKTKIEIIKNQLAESGIQLKVSYFATPDLYYAAIKDEECHLFMEGYSSELIGDPGNFLYTLFHSESSYNYMNYCNMEVDNMLDSAFREWNEENRKSIYRGIVKQVLADIPAVFSAHVKPHFVYNSHKIASIEASPYEFIYYHRLKMN